MKPGIRIKFVGILMLATLLPLAVAVTAVYVLGNKYYRQSSGEIFQNRAREMANYLVLAINGHTGSLQDHVALSDFYRAVEALNEERRQQPEEVFWSELTAIEREWQDLPPDSPIIEDLVTNELARQLRSFQRISPLFAEIFVTDSVGRMVATTGKTTNYWHAFKPWWQVGIRKPFKDSHVEGINYDESAGVYSFDLVIPIRDWRNPEAPAAGVIKAVVNASPIFVELTEEAAAAADWQLVLEDGTILFGPPPVEGRIPDRARDTLLEFESGWMLRRLRDGAERQMVGFTPLPWRSNIAADRPSAERPGNPDPSRAIEAILERLGNDGPWDAGSWAPSQRIFVLVHEEAALVLAPIRNQLLLISGTGALFVLACFFVGLYLAQYHIIRPINLLQAAAGSIASSAKLERLRGIPASAEGGSPLDPETRKLLNRVQGFKSEDELGELARDFNAMAQRVLSYHAHLEAAINDKIAEIQGDLVIAREFQEALMPREYPKVPDLDRSDSLSLKFNHIYQPASTVGGDFFNVIKLGPDRAGIFIADVMGHGSRSALVTAIVATLLHDLAPKASDPAQFMAALNRHFHHLIQHSKQVIFVTAFYLVIDTAEKRATYASAGHPPPLLIQRHKGTIKPLLHAMQNDTALGLLEESTYGCFSRPIHDDDLFLLFTDGLFEALNPKGEEFGIQKLIDVVNRNMEFSAGELGRRILETVRRYSGFAAQGDDICLVTVEVHAPDKTDPDAEAGTGSQAESGRKTQF